MVREDLITSAVSFLQDPSVASAPLEKRIAFLQSKNLTQEEIDLSIARAAEDGSQTGTAVSPSPPSPSHSYPPQPMRPPPQYGAYQGGYWPQPPPPDPPRRDWRDWFIMATVLSGLGYGAYVVTKRYITPLIAPPTPPQLSQDKTAIDADFGRAFALIDQLATDTAALKSAEEARTARLDTALGELEAVLGAFRDGTRRREDEHRRLGEEVRGLKELVPRALEAQGKEKDERLRELGVELKSLKTLVGNRVGGAGGAGGAAAGVGAGPNVGTGVGGSIPGTMQGGRPASGANMFGSQGTAATTTTVNGSGTGAGMGSGIGTGMSTSNNVQQQGGAATAATTSPGTNGTEEGRANSISGLPDRTASSSPFNRFSGRAAIPAWQMAASKKNQEDGEKKDTSESGTMAEPTAAS